MIHRSLFIAAHQVGDRNFYPTYKKVVKNQWKTYDELKDDQEKQLRHLINFSYRSVPYYHKLFDSLKLSPNDIRMVEDLEKLPILTKDIIKQNWDDFKPVNMGKIKYSENTTGGSTGTPFNYRQSKYDRFFGGALLYRGWSYAGYELGDKMVFLAGSSLDVGANSFIVKKAHEISRNIRKLSSFDMGQDDMKKYTDVINSFKPRFMRGYASSINFFANYIKENDVEIISPSAVFTTAEKLMQPMRKNIEEVFACDVYDTYGLNDGGVGAYECSEHCGLHIDTERSIMEVVDDTGFQINEGIGHILGTSLHNYAMPFIRYDTDDMGHIIEDACGCGRESMLLKEVMGRSVDVLLTPEGKSVHGWFFLYIFWEHCKGIKEYQVIQENIDEILIKIVQEDDFDEKQIEIIGDIIKRKSSGWDIEFRFVDKIERTKAGKYKFIISELV